jgi:hypothetical protein
MTISEDGQYVAGVYYKEWGGYNEVIEVRKISDYSLVFRKESKYSDWEPNFAPYQWASGYQFKFSKDNMYLAVFKKNSIIFNLLTGNMLFESNKYMTNCVVSENNSFFFIRSIINNDNSDTHTVCFYDCENTHFEELNYPDSNNVLYFFPIDLVFNDEYILVNEPDKYVKMDKMYYKVGDVALLKLNFDLTSIENKIPESNGILYPNPANDYINIIVQNIETIQGIEIYNVFGEGELTVETQNFVSLQKIDVSSLPPGVYFVRVGNEKPMKFVVVR